MDKHEVKPLHGQRGAQDPERINPVDPVEPPLVAWVMDAAPGEPLDEPIPYVLVEVAP